MHASNDLRDSFSDELEDFYRSKASASSEVFRKLCGKLWNCSDILPGHLHDMVQDLAPNCGASYAAAARVLRRAVF